MKNNKLLNFLKEDIKELEYNITNQNKEKIEQFFSYWRYHIESI